MLKLSEQTATDWPNPLTKFKLFEYKDDMGPSDSIPKVHNLAISHSHKTQHMNDNAKEYESDCSTPNTITQLSLLLTNDALAWAVSQVNVPMDNGWGPCHIFKLFIVLVAPPPDLDLDAIEGLEGYLTKLLAELLRLKKNGICWLICHCWWALISTCSTLNLLCI